MKNILLALSFFLLMLVASAQEIEGANKGQFSLRTNGISWLMLVPNIGLEYQFNDKRAIIVDGSFAAWNFKSKTKDNYWQLWHISPKIRNYINESRNAYVGLQLDIGEYNIANQLGDFKGGGINVGKQYYFSKNTLIDLGITLGYLQLSNRKRYHEISNVHYLSANKPNKNYWGPTQLSINIIRKLNSSTR